jgi:hypothetical protein
MSKNPKSIYNTHHHHVECGLNRKIVENNRGLSLYFQEKQSLNAKGPKGKEKERGKSTL